MQVMESAMKKAGEDFSSAFAGERRYVMPPPKFFARQSRSAASVVAARKIKTLFALLGLVLADLRRRDFVGFSKRMNAVSRQHLAMRVHAGVKLSAPDLELAAVGGIVRAAGLLDRLTHGKSSVRRQDKRKRRQNRNPFHFDLLVSSPPGSTLQLSRGPGKRRSEKKKEAVFNATRGRAMKARDFRPERKS
jgi:hypothetical protein